MSTRDKDISTAMTRHVIYMRPNDSLLDAYKIMKKLKIRHLPVVAAKKLVGIISDRDVLLWSTVDRNGEIMVPDELLSQAMSDDPVTIYEDESVAEACSAMIDHKIDCLPVVTRERIVVGLITSTDLLDLLRINDGADASRMIPFHFKLDEYRGWAEVPS